MAKGKKITEARKHLEKALRSHAEIVGGTAVSMKKAQRANAKLAAAVAEYAAAVERKTGVASPIVAGEYSGLEASTIASLTAERDAISAGITGQIPVVAVDAAGAPAATDDTAS